MIRISRNTDLIVIHDLMFDVNIVIGIGNRSAIYTSKIIRLWRLLPLRRIVMRTVVVRNFWGQIHIRMEIICGSKMPTRCNRGFYCRSYCLLNMFRAPLCPSTVAQEYYTVVSACGISCCGFQVAGLMWSWGLCVRFAGCWFTTGRNHCIILLSSWWLA